MFKLLGKYLKFQTNIFPMKRELTENITTGQ